MPYDETKDRSDYRCPTCKQRNSRVRQHVNDDGTVKVWHCNVKGCSNHYDYLTRGNGDEPEYAPGDC